MKPSSNRHFYFRMFKSLKPFFFSIYYGDILIPAVEREQDVFDFKIEELKKYRRRTKANIEDKNTTLTCTEKFYDGREMMRLKIN